MKIEWETKRIRFTNLCGWCREDDRYHCVDEYVGDYVDCECDDCGSDDDVRKCIIVAIEREEK